MELWEEVEETLAFNLEPAVEVDNVIVEHKELKMHLKLKITG